jgi:uncharacterized membrane-anchored protein YhcB (DUF1043 family)
MTGGEAQMGDQEKNAKEKFDATAKAIAGTAKNAPGKVIGIIILILIMLNTFWNLWENGNKISAELQAVKTDLAALAARQTELENSAAGSVDLENIKTDIELAKETVQSNIASTAKAVETFETKLDALVRAEETKLEILLREAENRRIYIQELKNLLAGENGQ